MNKIERERERNILPILNLAHVKNNKALLKIAFNHKKAYDLPSHVVSSGTVLLLSFLPLKHNGRFEVIWTSDEKN